MVNNIIISIITRNYLKKIHDEPFNGWATKDNIRDLFQKVPVGVSLWDKLTTNKWVKVKEKSREYLVKEMNNIKNDCINNAIKPEIVLNQVSELFLKIDFKIFHNPKHGIMLEDEKREFEKILISHRLITLPLSDNDNQKIKKIIEYVALLSYRQHQTFDEIRSQYFSCFNNQKHSSTKSITKLLEEIEKINKISATEKLSIAINASLALDSHQAREVHVIGSDEIKAQSEEKFARQFGMNRFELARQALNEGAQIYDAKKRKDSPGYKVVTSNLVEMSQEFILHKACMTKLSALEFFDLIHLSIKSGHKDIVEIFLNYKNAIDPENLIKDPIERNLLIEAVSSDKTEIAKLLFNTKKFNVDEIDNTIFRFAALHYAASLGNRELISMLIEAGANPYILSERFPIKYKRTPIELAKKKSPQTYKFIHTKLKKIAVAERKEAEPILTKLELGIGDLHNVIQDYLYFYPPENVTEKSEQNEEDS